MNLNLCLLIGVLLNLPNRVEAHPMFQDRVLALLRQPLPADLQLARVQRGQLFEVSYEPVTSDNSIPLSTLHSWKLKILPQAQSQTIEEVDFTGGMPQHQHSLPSSVTIEKESIDSYTVQGIKFHMPGWWRVKTCIKASRGSECISFDLVL
ncbi:MAG: hypothetical protein NTX25_18030 [Proteobacteria bacterium]|nr:hypothetical protein [Pseudomonadota bacterium]